ncbi:MAG: class II D-tagatose-bisphosphate aldolase, non-catalytic subunit [Clostridia bacterium]|nr:class II D-tagatose-bisphosphate aldolase, non-catalytic subunit [Clostridia bacterium]
MHKLRKILKQQKEGKAVGICSVCSSSRFVIDAALVQARETGSDVLIEATANQVNQLGGYTGMKPADFRDFVLERAEVFGLPADRIILGGDHLGPVAWKGRPAEEAMKLADDLVYEFARAGFTKIHLDCSMPLGDEVTLSTEEIADRTVRLAKISERGFAEYKQDNPDTVSPVYVIGSEVPTPGGSGDEEGLTVTKASDLLNMLECFQEKFEEAELPWRRVVAAVVQPGVEFGNSEVHEYVPSEAELLTETAKATACVVLEGHSTDYQKEKSLAAMVRDGIAILKVGPALTFAAREALYALEMMEKEMYAGTDTKLSAFAQTLDEAMLADPSNWKGHYTDEEPQSSFLRKYSYSDRSRYYMNVPEVQESLSVLMSNLMGGVPATLLSQYMPAQYTKLREGYLKNEPEALVIDKVRETLDQYWRACGQEH